LIDQFRAYSFKSSERRRLQLNSCFSDLKHLHYRKTIWHLHDGSVQKHRAYENLLLR